MSLKNKAAAAFLALSVSSSALAAGKEVVSLSDYWKLQAKNGPTVTHMNYTPFPKQIISIPINSSVHGDITLKFNTHTFIPRRAGNGNINLIPTIAVIAATHSGLGSLNDGDAPSMKRAINLLAESPEMPTINKLEAINGDDHLDVTHGITLFNVVNHQIVPGKQMKTILKACKDELQP